MSAINDSVSVLELTGSAVEQVRRLQISDSDNKGKALRIYVEGSCCSNLQYGMVFDEKKSNDEIVQFGDVEVIVDSESAHHLRGAKVDFLCGPAGSGFKISNPNVRLACGCGK